MTTKYHTHLAKVTNLVAAASDSGERCCVSYNSTSVDFSVNIPDDYISSDFISSDALGFIANFVSIASIYPSIARSGSGNGWFVTFSFKFDNENESN